MTQYRELVRYSLRALDDPPEFVREQERRMNAAAAELRFETAGKIKQYIDQLKQIGKGPLRHVRPMGEFVFVSLQRGPRAGTTRVFLITPGMVEEVLGLTVETIHAGQIVRVALERAAECGRVVTDSIGAERVGIATHHLFSGKSGGGSFLRLDTLDEKSIGKAYRELLKQPEPQEVDGEGVIKELQSL
jgi:Mg-chelatase subunit ChlD